MKKIAFILLSFGLFSTLQARPVTLPSPSKKAVVAEWISLTKVEIEYHSPGVKGRDGQIYGGIVPIDGGDPIPWRAGANENTTVFFEDDVLINGKSLKAGKYGFRKAAPNAPSGPERFYEDLARQCEEKMKK